MFYQISGNCINALADGLRHIPYRDSKLTRLLKDSLGGNCRSVMIAAVTRAHTSFEDTFNTLRYAERAKTIKTKVSFNLNPRFSMWGGRERDYIFCKYSIYAIF